jgi:hypothetical protein
MKTTFEELYELVRALNVPTEEGQRLVEWCDGAERIGIARDRDGGYEIFVTGDELRPTLPIVARHLQYDSWDQVDRPRTRANRIVLSSAPHFASVSCFLVEELYRHDAPKSPQSAFAEIEPLVEMALLKPTVEEETAIGLLGELCLLEQLIESAQDAKDVARCIESWRGYEQAARDFMMGRYAVEVKSTRGNHSYHHISNISQVDPHRDIGGEPLEDLFLVSCGFVPPDSRLGAEISIPERTDQILRLLADPGVERNAIQELFLERLRQFGLGDEAGYDHDTMQGDSTYGRSWSMSFCRVYSMNSPDMDVIRRSEVEQRSYVPVETLSFVIELPSNADSGGLFSDGVSDLVDLLAAV